MLRAKRYREYNSCDMKANYSPAFPPNSSAADEEAIEPEIVGGPMPFGRGARADESLMGRFRSFILRIKILFSAAIVLMALTLIIAGAVLTSTFIGAVLGIPLMLAGALIIWLLFKALTFGKAGNVFIFKRY